MKTTNEFENIYWPKRQTILGIDEVGRGPLCGPLVVCGVILPIDYQNDEIYDSKKLSDKKKTELYDIIIKDAISYHVEIVEPKVIDELNIYQATKQAMERIALLIRADMILTDAMPLSIDKPYIKVIKGDQKSINIAAASIVAKCVRDNIMIEYDKEHPEYGFKNHKGYPTKQHLLAIEEHGLLSFYRMSYGPCMKAIQIKLDI